MSKVEQMIDVDVPVRSAYDQWTQFEEFPRFMEGVEDVRQLDDRHCHWRTKIAGVQREFDTEIVDQLPDERIAWRSTGGGLRQKGVVSFQPLDAGHTRVRLAMDVEPEGMVEKTADALGMLDRRVKGDLRRFKGFIEDHDQATGGWRGRIRPQDAADGRGTRPDGRRDRPDGRRARSDEGGARIDGRPRPAPQVLGHRVLAAAPRPRRPGPALTTPGGPAPLFPLAAGPPGRPRTAAPPPSRSWRRAAARPRLPHHHRVPRPPAPAPCAARGEVPAPASRRPASRAPGRRAHEAGRRPAPPRGPAGPAPRRGRELAALLAARGDADPGRARHTGPPAPRTDVLLPPPHAATDARDRVEGREPVGAAPHERVRRLVSGTPHAASRGT